MYKQKNDFECLDGSKTVPYEQVNDDYCDCQVLKNKYNYNLQLILFFFQDGSDEPGTSACSNGRFHCINLGFKPLDVPSSRVNDYICDCCDGKYSFLFCFKLTSLFTGSDEWDSGVQCPNTCSKMGQKAREAAEEHKKTVTAGFAKRSELAKEGEKLVKEKTSGVDELRKQLETLQATKDEAEKKKTQAEESEMAAREVEDKLWEEERAKKRRTLATELFEKLDVNKDNKLTLDDLMQAIGLDQDSNGEVSEDEAKNYLYGLEELDFEAFFEKAFNQLRRILKEKKVQPVEEAPETTDQPESEEIDETSEDETPIEPENKSDDDDLDVRPPYSAAVQKIIDETTQIRNDYNEAVRRLSEVETTVRYVSDFFVEVFEKMISVTSNLSSNSITVLIVLGRPSKVNVSSSLKINTLTNCASSTRLLKRIATVTPKPHLVTGAAGSDLKMINSPLKNTIKV